MKIYCIVEQGWGGMHYNPNDVYCFSTEEKRDAAYKRLRECPAYEKADIDLLTFESELDKD